MTTSPDSSAETRYNPWARAGKALFAFQWKLFEVQFQVGADILEGMLRSVSKFGPSVPATPHDDVAAMEKLATERIRQGFAPPREIYQVPYRGRIDWSRFPEWAKPSDPELFEGCVHEG